MYATIIFFFREGGRGRGARAQLDKDAILYVRTPARKRIAGKINLAERRVLGKAYAAGRPEHFARDPA